MSRLLARLRIEPFTLALVGTVVLASVLPARGAFAELLGHLTGAMIALLFFLHGARLAWATVRAGLLHWRLQLVIFATTFAVFPAIGVALGHLLSGVMSRDLLMGIIYLCLLPSTVQSSIAFTSMARGNVPAAICAASFSNIVGVVVTPVLVGLAMSVSGHSGIDGSAIRTILMQLLAPFVLGQILQPWVGNWVRARKKLLMPVDRGSILMVVYSAFSAAVIGGIWQAFGWTDLGLVLAVDALILVGVLVLTTRASRAMGFGHEDEIAIVFCGSKKSLASGVPMANAIFPAASIGAVLLPIMLFHQIQLIACSVLAQRYARRPEPGAPLPAGVEPTGAGLAAAGLSPAAARS
ncbi:bile acid:sodium symporter family protein [Frigidibacter sp. MR17.14]|uniref:bile acid:sodium symporter family protein n=1 Tax=Frigidibacter sp. MR17.14 TaxID=3126509 RepID=UPI003012D7C7